MLVTHTLASWPYRSVIPLPHDKHVSCYKTCRKSLVYFLMHESCKKSVPRRHPGCYTECSNAFVAVFGCRCLFIRPNKGKNHLVRVRYQEGPRTGTGPVQLHSDHGDCKLSRVWTCYLLVSPLSTVIALQICSGGWYQAYQCRSATQENRSARGNDGQNSHPLSSGLVS